VLVRPPRLIFAELKTASGRVSAAQEEWLHNLSEVGVAARTPGAGSGYGTPTALPVPEVYLWRPDDLQDIANLLAGNGIDPEIGRSFAAERAPGVRAVTPLVRPHRKGRETRPRNHVRDLCDQCSSGGMAAGGRTAAPVGATAAPGARPCRIGSRRS
jgi:hypothetical protein